MTAGPYRPNERPDVEVHVDGVWHPGELRDWLHREDGTWWANGQWRRRPGETYIDTVPADHVRPSRLTTRMAEVGEPPGSRVRGRFESQPRGRTEGRLTDLKIRNQGG